MKKMETSVSILGQIYDIKFTDENDNYELLGNYGICDCVSKDIYININTDKDTVKTTITHELIHALLEESGLTKYSEDEIIVEWIAVQLPKLNLLLDEIIRKIRV